MSHYHSEDPRLTICHLWRIRTANLVLQDTIERIYAGNVYADVPRGIFLVRGENVLLLGEVVSDFWASALLCLAYRAVMLIRPILGSRP